MKFSLGFPAFVLLSILFAPTIDAHEPGFSTATVTVVGEQVEAVVTFSTEEIDLLLNSSSRADLEAFAGQLLLVNRQEPFRVDVYEDDDNNSIFRFLFTNVGLPVQIRSPLIGDLRPGHRQYLLVRDRHHDLLLQKLLRADANSAVLTQEAFEPSSEAESPLEKKRRMKIAIASLILGTFLAIILLWSTMKLSLRFAKRVFLGGDLSHVSLWS